MAAKILKMLLGCAAIAALALVLTGCEGENKKAGELGIIEAEKKKAEERGRVPKQTVDSAQQKVDAIEDQMKDRLKQVE